VLTGPLRVEVKRLKKVTEEESGAREIDIETLSGDSPQGALPGAGNVYVDEFSDTSEEKRAKGRAWLFKPLKRARGRPHKDGMGPFRLPTPSIDQVVEMVMEGEGWPPFGHEPFTALEQWKASRHRSLWFVVSNRDMANRDTLEGEIPPLVWRISSPSQTVRGCGRGIWRGTWILPPTIQWRRTGWISDLKGDGRGPWTS